MKLQSVSIVVLNYNCKDYIIKCLSALSKLNYPKSLTEIIVVDNASTDKSLELVKKKFKNIKILKLDKNYGFSEGNNRALDVAKGDYLAFVSCDVFVDKNWLIELVKHVEKDVAICASKIVFQNIDFLNSLGLYWTIFATAGEMGLLEKDSIKYNKVREVIAPHGAAFLVNKRIFENLGGFDRDYFIYAEDMDLGWRVWNNGLRVLYIPTAVAYHVHSGAASKKGEYFRQYYNTRNSFITLVKNADFINLLRSTFLFFSQKLILFSVYTFSGRIQDSLAILEALKWIIKNPKFLLKKRILSKQTKIINKFIYGPYLAIKMFTKWKRYQNTKKQVSG